MKRAFIFDMDGVLVGSEEYWVPLKKPFLEKILGKDILEEMGDMVGKGLDRVYEEAIRFGAQIDRNAFFEGYDGVAKQVYAAAPLTEGIDDLADYLVKEKFHLGIVTQSPQNWIDRVLPRIRFRNKIEVVLSLHERKDLNKKPAPDGFTEVFKELNADPGKSVVLEDSNTGIAAAKAAGAYTIGYQGNLIFGYEQDGADAYALSMSGVRDLVRNFLLAT